jgi:predicted alpha/beta hydrolase family esterase
MEIKLLIIPGLGDSGQGHWQNNWLQKYKNSTKVVQDNWEEPIKEEWLERLNEAIQKLNSPTILVAHSLAVSLVMHWASTNSNPNVIGALLVAPADVDSAEHTPEKIWNFSPIPLVPLHFPSIVVTSENDPYISSQRAAYFSKMWGSDFINIGQKGHVNSESNLEFWEEGQLILEQLIARINTKL